MIKLKPLCVMALSCLSVGVTAESLYVFYPTEVTAKSVEKSIQEVCPNTDITVFGRSKDFRKEIGKAPPNAILSLKPVIESVSEYKSVAKGFLQGKAAENYVLVSVDTAMALEDLSNKKVGVIDLLGRKPMTQFIEGLFGEKVKLKRVTKVEDLLPLLTFGAVDGIFVSKSMFEALKQKSNLELVSLNLDIEVGLAAVGTTENHDSQQIVQCLSNFNKDLNTTLGVEQWRQL